MPPAESAGTVPAKMPVPRFWVVLSEVMKPTGEALKVKML